MRIVDLRVLIINSLSSTYYTNLSQDNFIQEKKSKQSIT